MVTFGEETVQKTPALHYTGLLDNPFSNLELPNLTLTWKRKRSGVVLVFFSNPPWGDI